MESPVLFLLFNRPDLASRVFEAIRAAQPPRFYIAVDGPREGRDEERAAVEECREFANLVDWPCEVKTLFRDENLGCGRAVSEAISWFFSHEEEGIILEDDCLPNPDFFQFCDGCLERFRDELSIVHVGGDLSLKFSGNSPESPFFSKYTPVWGWATWRRAWNNYEFTLTDWRKDPEVSAGIRAHLDSQQAFRFWSSIFDQMADGLVDTWDYQLTYSAFVNRGLSVMPPVNLISNIGFDPRATHTRNEEGPRSEFPSGSLSVEWKFPTKLVPDDRLDKLFEEQYFGIRPAWVQFFTRFQNFGIRLFSKVKRRLPGHS
ncbi:MAG: hypothetical protein AAGF67_07295 [Verrucomicrobiota bacterium]